MRGVNRKYILNGILIGAAVGAGFAAIESMDYAFFRIPAVFTQYGLDAEFTNYSLLLRGLYAPGGHVVWAALYGGALGMAKGAEKLHPRHFLNKSFILCFGIAFALHFAWNHEFELFTIEIPVSPIPDFPLYLSVKAILLTVIAWIVLLRLIKLGVIECMRIPQTVPASVPQREPVSAAAGAGIPQAVPYASSPEIRLRGLSGMYRGNVFPSPSGRLVIGRDNRIANVVFPPNAPGISSVHCEIHYQNGVIYITDKNSSNGTYMADGTRLTPGQPYPLARLSGFYLATRENMFEIE
jgi:hypothetical protein